jgi:Mrp family chromosome partitioning ATPase
MGVLIEELRKEYDFVVIDSPPLLNLADSRVLARVVEGILLVVKGGETPREVVRKAQNYLLEVGGNVIGVVLNDIDVASQDYYYYNLYSYSGDESDGGGVEG